MSRLRNLVAFLLLAGLWGLSFPAITVGLESLPPLLFAAVRYDVAGVLLLAYLAARGFEWRPRSREDVLAIGIAGAFLIAGGSLLFVGQRTVPSGIASILYGLIPILTTGFAAALLPAEPIAPRRIAGVVLGFLGVGVIARPDPANLLTAELVGIGFVVAAAVSIALGSVLLRSRRPTLGTAPMTAWAMLLGALLLHAGSVAVGEPTADIAFSTTAVASILYLGVFASALAYAIYFRLLDLYGPLEINLVSYVVPLFATAGGVALLGETVTLPMVVGFVLIAGGFVVLKARTLREELWNAARYGRG